MPNVSVAFSVSPLSCKDTCSHTHTHNTPESQGHCGKSRILGKQFHVPARHVYQAHALAHGHKPVILEISPSLPCFVGTEKEPT
eukprot:6474167-Amphidinium_carterae.2